ncbi:MAG: competence/damage-inducible protein A [Bacteroidetes bacterium]|nr:competence/damage-inducible protein A [Bacteroidota bacterium]
MKISLLIIGDEILSGETLDTNAHFISKILNENGFNINQKLTVGDTENEIINGIEFLYQNSDFIITTGGLGPTKDDVTKYALMKYFGGELVVNQEMKTYLTERYQKRGLEVNELTSLQASVPSSAEVLINTVGTAPVMWFNQNNKQLVTLPGVPYEMKYLIENLILPKLLEKFSTAFILHETIRTVAVPESKLAAILNDVEAAIEAAITTENYYKLAYLPELGMVKLRLTGIGKSQTEITANLAKWKKEIDAITAKYIYGFGDESLATAVGKLLMKKSATLGIAESCTGGFLSHLITSATGSSAYYLGSVISYGYEVKTNLLGVQKQTLESHGAVSEETCNEMVSGTLKQLNTTYAIAITGIAGPGGGTPEKPVGTVWIGVGNQTETITKKFLFDRNRTENIQLSAVYALDMLRKFIEVK